MEKLKPILAQRFWIISAPAILLPVIAWWMATGRLAADIDKRFGELNTAFTSIPPVNDSPNGTWAAGLKIINAEVEKQNKESADYLWQMQKDLMFWPDNIAETMSKVPYRGDVPNSARDLYRSSYRPTLMKVHKIVQPYDIETGKGQILADLEIMPQVEQDRWEILAPTAEEMWDAQEDIWLLKSVLESVQRVNEAATLVTESPIRSIEVLEFRGGSKSAPGGTGGAMAGALAAGTPGALDAGKAAMGMRDSGSMNNNQQQGPKSADFPPEDEFGSDVDTSATAGAEGAGAAGGAGAAAGGAGALARPGMGMGMGGQGEKKIRYVDDDPAHPFKTRGFYLQVVMEIRRVPHLMVELTNSPWPVRIVRVQQADLILDDFEIEGGGRGGMMGGGRMGAGVPAAAGRGASGRSQRPGTMDRPANAGKAGGTRPGIDPMRRGGAAGGAGGSGNQSMDYQNMATAALSDPDLCTVAIAGVMTIYRPIEKTADPATPGTVPGTPEPIAGAPNAEESTSTPADETTNESAPTSESATESTAGETTAEETTDEPAPESGTEPDATESPASGDPAEPATTDDKPVDEAESTDSETPEETTPSPESEPGPESENEPAGKKTDSGTPESGKE